MVPPEEQKGVEIAPMPLIPVDKRIADTSLLTEILLQKYEYQSRITVRYGNTATSA